MKIIVPISSKNQVTIPKEIRKVLKIKDGDRLVFAEEYGKVFLEVESKKTSCPVCEGKGDFEDSKNHCFICLGTGLIKEDFQVLDRINKWLEVYGVRTEYLIKGPQKAVFYIPDIDFIANTYLESELKKSRDFALVSLVGLIHASESNLISYEDYLKLKGALYIEDSKKFLEHYKIKELN